MTDAELPRISRERWAQLEPLIDAALELDANERASFVARIARDDADLAGDLNRLLGYGDGNDVVLEAAAVERSGLLAGTSNTGTDDHVREELQAALDGFTIERELGGGGMSRVFVAHDARLDRHVVIKVMMPELNARVSAGRFARETKLSASLQQANIVPVIAAGSAAGLPYFVMPFVEGRSLRERLARNGPLPLGDALGILRDIARALAYAHSRGIVHRDIKPGNVLLSGGAAVVTDFGIAKAVVDATSSSSESGDGAVTDAGAMVGTPTYMAPEQAIGDPGTDHRADIYAFGCVAFELLTGKPPFAYDEKHRVIAAHLNEHPPSVADIRPDAAPVAALIAQCLAKEPARRPQTAAELLVGLDRAGSVRPVTRARRGVALLAVGGIALILLVAIWNVRRPPGTTARVVSSPVRQAAMSGTAAPRSRRVGTANMAAYELYLRGRDPLLMRTDSATRVGLGYFLQALALDSTFALGYAGLARMYARLAISGDPARTREYIALGRAAGTKAVVMDDSLAEAHYELGFVESTAHHFSVAERELRRALELDPQLSEAGETLAVVYELTERPREALSQARQTLRVDPMSRSAVAEYARALYENGDCDAALAEAAKVAALRPPLLRVANIISLCDAEQSRWADAVSVIENASIASSSAGPGNVGVLGNVLARGGRRAEAERVRDELVQQRRAGHASAGAIAMVEAGLGNVDAALAWFDTAVTDNGVKPELMGPALATVRRDPRFDRIRARLGIRKPQTDK
jgi:tRNA A-37 threonylcarbamoyl transferase component Bud32/tetratricopeptide (TPR) repeat protein